MIADPQVRTAAGAVRGRHDGGVAIFRGIPYAQPPVGPLRFGAPLPARPWDGLREAFAFGPAPGSAAGTDWLSLTVWSPDPGAAGLPVIVWICGGGYLQADSANPHHDGAALARAGAVVVGINYRVGVEGFAHLDGAPDNRGVLDQAAALRWVRHNIAAFGGDSGNVTVFGQSAGAGSIAAMLVMPDAAGLFRRAVAQSVPGTYFSARLAAEIASTISARLGARATATDLARFAPHELVRATGAVLHSMPAEWGPIAATTTPFSPVVDGDVLPRAPWAALADGAARGIDLLVGHTRDEYRLIAAEHAGPLADDQVTAALDGLVAGGRTAYPAAYPEATPGTLHELVHGDWLFRMPTLHLADAHRAGGGRAWCYELGWGPGPNGASHGLDALLVLDTLDDHVFRSMRADQRVRDEARLVTRRMQNDWLAFATTGDPGWAAFGAGARPTRVYDVETTTGPYPEERSRRIWRRHRFDVMDLPT